MSSDYLLVLPLEKVTLGNSYGENTDLPLHCTLMPWFRLSPSLSLGSLASGIQRMAQRAKIPEVELVSQTRALFGPKHDILVHTIEKNEQLTTLHRSILLLLATCHSQPNDLEFAGERYQPHATDTLRKQFLPGEACFVRKIVVVERNEAKSKLICRIIPLS